MATTVARNPYARGEYKRFTHGNRDLVHSPMACEWCGQTPARLYAYVCWGDAKAEPHDDNGYWFCNLDCHNAYNS